MKKKIKIAVGFLTVLFCILLGCEKREKELEVLFLEESDMDDMFSGQSETENISPEFSEMEKSREETRAGADLGMSALSGVNTAGQNEAENNSRQIFAEPERCVVHICGAVKQPGVYTLADGDRIYQAIEKAGGFREDAEQDYLNQADLLSDGMKIYVPTQVEIQEAESDFECIIPGGEVAGSGQEAKTKNADENSSLVNINTAGEEQLCTLPGVGSSKARSIIAYREQNGAYKAIEDIMNVEGIKDGVFQKIKDSITV